MPKKEVLPPVPPIRRRARSAEAKERVRAMILEAGRAAFATQEFERVSLRGIASAAGYSPSVIYTLFVDRQDLFLAIREKDLEGAVQYIEEMLSSSDDPAERLRSLFLVATDYWRNHLDQYEVLYAKPLHRPAAKYTDGSMFGMSVIAKKSAEMWHVAVKEYLDSVGNTVTTARLGAECLLLAMHGIVSIPPRQQSKTWLRSEELARETINSFIEAWAARGKK